MTEEWDVLIAGAGPTGLTLANHLGALGVRVLVAEKLPALIDYPRGVGVDDEALRSFQAVGLAEAVRRHTVPNQIMRFVDRRGRVLASIEPTAQPFGWPRRNGFIQPLVDRELAAGLSRFPQVRLALSTAVEAFHEVEDGVEVTLQRCDPQGVPDGERSTVRARFLVGADGGRSPVREALGLSFDGLSESTRWLVIDLADDPIGTPNVQFVLDDDFPYVELALPHGVRRFEFMVPAGASAEEYESDDRIRMLMQRVLPGVTPNVIRRRVYMHHARIAPTFRKGRVLLAGDAAHLMPVWQGQGFNTGIRDATNLAWKLALVAQGRADDGLLDTYTQERHAHAGAMIDLSVLVGRIFVPSNPALRLARNLLGPLLSRIGPVRRYIAEMRFKPMPFFADGVVAHPGGTPDPKGQVGKVFMQPRVAGADGRAVRLDDAIGMRFALLCWSARPDAWIDADARAILRALGAAIVVVRPDCQSPDREPPVDGSVLADVDGAFKRFFDTAPGSIVVLRPDRVVAAVCQPASLGSTLRTLAGKLRLRGVDGDPAIATRSERSPS
ncbi:MAG: hypothetical protein RIS35_2568 [Pseudomonadota bacterium]